ncbi:unnamed protein product [Triticum aestivum]|uniref:DUF6598 domain-containing protein n=3 Tax=Triticinae TaxID=1648030 RepID=A0A9R1F000_WHEAT|nr:uncharacterized protein LOC123050614 [Triticum aestivum]KAF7019588.1 hypothetical protein CFC21_032747 [Triticum aestivum]SPT20873.1 unnamed protein product [Triticum aestivum]
MEVEAMSSALAGLKIHSSDGVGCRNRGRENVGGAKTTRPLRLKIKSLTRKSRIRRDENRPPTPTRDERWAEEPENLPEVKEEDAIARSRRIWDRRWAGRYGAFEDETSIGPMRYTSKPPTPEYLFTEQTVQIFSIRVRAPTDGLKWPLRVYGHIATRDSMDQNRNYLFRRTRDNCQTLSQDDPSLLLTGPSRAIVYLAPITFEVQLKVKGKGESEDEMLAFGAFYYDDGSACERKLSIRYDHKRCMLEYEVALRPRSVEATISLKVVVGSWPENHRGIVVAITSGIDEKIVLLRCRDREPPIDPDGSFELSRRVVSVDLGEKLLVAVDASLSDFLMRATAVFKPACSGTSHGVCDLGSCKVEVTVAWSLFVIVVP